jgi:hypothetical protein
MHAFIKEERKQISFMIHASWIHLKTDCRSFALALYYDQQDGRGIGEEKLISQDLTLFAVPFVVHFVDPIL